MEDNAPQNNRSQSSESRPDGSGERDHRGSKKGVSFAQILQRIRERGEQTTPLQWADEFEKGVYYISFSAEMPPGEMPPGIEGSYCAHLHVLDPADAGDEERVKDNVIDLRVYEGDVTREIGGKHETIQYVPKPYADRLREKYQEEVVDPIVAACPDGTDVQSGLPALTYSVECDEAGDRAEYTTLEDIDSNRTFTARKENNYPVYTGFSGEEDQRRRTQCPIFHLCEVHHDVDPTSEDGIETVLIDARSLSAALSLYYSGACSEFYSIAAPSFVEAKEQFGRVAAQAHRRHVWGA